MILSLVSVVGSARSFASTDALVLHLMRWLCEKGWEMKMEARQESTKRVAPSILVKTVLML